MKEIDNYMNPAEAVHIYKVSASTLRNKLQEGYSTKSDQERAYLIEQGLLKYIPPEILGRKKKGDWIIHRKAMEYWFQK
ncbi:DNA-binding protein [Bacillus pseudomycoides]|uniref:DNA-binding protein n=1 Tax=Bacillus pseudomycoides TaxID=64104 RepID=UPI00215A8D84|nr:DNA-binding protein [Bacillus pseudomycoides]MCR8860383.1 DNA-binding protein [Bacillus pseudomycoides]